MKTVVDGKVYDTDSSYLVKFVVKTEDLGNGYTRVVEMGLYFRKKKSDYYLYVRKIATEPSSKVFDIQDCVYPVDEEFVRKFNHKYNDVSLLTK